MVGPTNAEVGVVIAYDVMGLSCNTKQGADIVSPALDAIVFTPDFFQGVYADAAWLPPDTEEKREKFFGERNPKTDAEYKVTLAEDPCNGCSTLSNYSPVYLLRALIEPIPRCA